MNSVYVDFNKTVGKVKPLNGVCCAPYAKGLGERQKYIDRFFKEGNIPFCRTHDCCGAYGGTYFVDISNIFRDFDADENSPESYDFHYSDEYLKAIYDSGCQIYYRLGETIEWGSRKYRVNPPRDFAKWARICEHIIMHYNEGWADGFRFGITYWEIWNEPENPGDSWGASMWTGTKEEYFGLYAAASKYLKSRFPDIKIGGYGGCGFYEVTRTNIPNSFKEFIPYFTDFLQMVKKENCPLDFYSWHIYTGDETELFAHAKYVRETLNKYGCENTESHLNEWNIHSEGAGYLAKHTMEGGSFNIAVLCELQNTDYVDKAMYYCFSLAGKYNGFIDQNDGETVEPSWYAYTAFGDLYALGNAVCTERNGEIYASAAKNEIGKCEIVLANYNAEDGEVDVDVKGMREGAAAHIFKISDSGREFVEIASVPVSANGRFELKTEKHTVIKIVME